MRPFRTTVFKSACSWNSRIGDVLLSWMMPTSAGGAGRTQRDVQVAGTEMDLKLVTDTPVPGGGHVGGELGVVPDFGKT